MTACTNKARGAVVAALAGVLALGAVPAVALATGTEAPEVDLMFADPEGAFSNASVTYANFTHGNSGNPVTVNSDRIWTTTFDKNEPVILNTLTVSFFNTGAHADFTITANDPQDDYEVKYYKRGADGKPADDQEITSDISAVGKYVAVVNAVDGNYKGGTLYVPFDITPIELTSVAVEGRTVTYNAEAHTFKFFIDNDGDGSFTNGDVKLYENVDYTVYYVLDDTDADESSAVEVKNVDTYRAILKGIGNYGGTFEVSTDINVVPLDLETAPIMGVVSTDSKRPADPYYIWIDGVRYEEGSAIMDELKCELDPSVPTSDSLWKENGEYSFIVSSENGPSDKNILNSKNFNAYKVGTLVDFKYNGEELPESHDIYMDDSSTDWDTAAVTGFAANGTVDGVTIPNSNITEIVFNAAGTDVTSTAWQDTPGSYTVVEFYYDASDGSLGGIDFVTVNVYREAINADADAAVLYDTNGDGQDEVVSSVNAGYVAGRNLIDDIDVVVKSADGPTLTEGVDYQVKYYNSNGHEVGEIVNAGTYTLKVTSEYYKISGTTEMTITISPLDVSAVRVGALEEMPFDNSDNTTTYLPWLENGYALSNTGFFTSLDIQYQSGDNWDDFPMNAIQVTILDAEGNEVETIMDEGAYTLHFEARNADAENNYVVPADITFHCIKAEHLLFADAAYTDYFADAVAAVNARGFMNGYNDTWLFGSYDQITRGQVACVLYNMATYAGQVDESELVYNEIAGYETGFSDVDGKAFYGKAIAWAKQAGVVNGYGDGTFAPDAPVTREEFAAMVANYASKYDQGYKAVESTDALKDFDDANGVSEWAEKVVAWAVENGIMGNGGFLAPQSNIIRADAACMVYNYAIAE